MPIWSPFPYEQAVIRCKYIDQVFKPLCGPDLAEWNLNWLFDFKALSFLDGSMDNMTKYFKAANSKVQGAIVVDIEDNLFGIKDLAETVGPVEFVESFMRRPYQHTTITKMCGEEVWRDARVNAEKLTPTMVDRSEEAKVEEVGAIQKARVIAFPKRTA